MRYEPAEQCPPLLALGAALQIFVPNTISIILLTTLVVRASGQSERYLGWVVFTALAISGLSIILHAFPFRYLESGRLVVTNFNIPLLAISVLALEKGGPSLLASLVVASTLLQFLLIVRLASLRRVFTPTVSGIVIMLVAVSAVPFIVDRTIGQSFDTSPRILVPGIVALGVGLWGALQSSPVVRLWTLPLTVAAGLAVAVPMGLYDTSEVTAAPWFSFPEWAWPGFDLAFGIHFWSLLPAFLFVKLTAFLKAVGDLSVIYRASYRQPTALDFRVIQSGLNVYGVTTLLTGILGTLPVSAPWSSTAVYISFTGVAARSVGIYLGLLTLGIAPLSKLLALLVATPSSVVSAVYIIIFGLLFVEGAKTVFAGQIDNKKAAITGVSLVLGISAGSFTGLLAGIAGELIGSAIIVGSVAAISMTLYMEFVGYRRRKLQIELTPSSLPAVDGFLGEFASRHGWSEAASNRLRLVGEEVLLSLLDQDDSAESGQERKLMATIHSDGQAAEIEIVVIADTQSAGNIEDRLAYLNDDLVLEDAEQLSMRLLRHYASSVHHRKYHGIDIVTCRVDK